MIITVKSIDISWIRLRCGLDAQLIEMYNTFTNGLWVCGVIAHWPLLSQVTCNASCPFMKREANPQKGLLNNLLKS
ncbi:hypothetical protein L6452_34978 [Arctium lappa]|uniref:Uncharacterized protein n=1 Tax=Arctium lappa TaxID=4217 RepID=A0ACB8YNX5_ARCLA|nr:hypothetical protein L6452_34978 [Arctium lappa]